jgi:hypothetical protein
MGVELGLSHLTDKNRLRVFENRFLRRMVGSKTDGVTGECRKLHNEELHILYPSPNIIKQMKPSKMTWVWHVVHMG